MQKTPTQWQNFLILGLVSLVWGSSFILIKKGVAVYSPLQIACLRIILSSLVFLPFAWKQLSTLKRKDLAPILWVGWIGSAIPAFLFPLAQTHTDSAVASMLNTFVPLNVFILGLLFFGVKFKWNKLFGVLLGLSGVFFLLFNFGSGQSMNFNAYALFILLGGICYATSVNTVKTYAQHIHPLTLTLAAFLSAMPIALILLLTTDFPHRLSNVDGGGMAFFYIFLLAALGTAMANVIFFHLTQRTNALFASSVTYLIPIVALFWGVLDGEIIGWNHLVGLSLALCGVYMTSR